MTFPAGLAIFVERRTLVMLALGFSSGLPLLLIFDTLSVWLRGAGLSLEAIGFFSLVTLVYSVKFLWAPPLDRAAVPVLTAWLGHRRSWMLVCQGAIMLGLWLVSVTDPVTSLRTVAVLALFIGFFSATQDIAVDAWRIEAAELSRQGAMAAAYQWGYRMATLVAGAVPLLLAGRYGWNVSYAVMAALMSVGVVAVLAAPREAERATRPVHGLHFTAAFVDPWRDFFVRYGSAAALILALVCVYRLSELVRNIMNPFYLDLGYTLAQIAEVRKIFGVIMTMLGVLAGGLAVARFGILRALAAGAVLGPLSSLVFAWLATQGNDLGALVVVTAIENVSAGFAGTCLIAYMSSLTSGQFTATQYAFFSSLYALPGRLLASQSGRIVESAAGAAEAGGVLSRFERLFVDLPPGSFVSGVRPAALGTGYVVFFLYSALLGMLGIALAFAVLRRHTQQELAQSGE